MRRPRWITVLCTIALFAPLAAVYAQQQDPATVPPAAPGTQSSATSSSKSSKTKYSHANDFLIRGTIFTEKALSFPGVELRIRKAGEKKFRWESYTNSRGEFAVRVPQGADYELVVRAKGFAEQTRTVDAKNGMSEENMVFRMQPAAGGKG